MIQSLTTISFFVFALANAHDFLLWTPQSGSLLESDSRNALENAVLLTSPTHPTYIAAVQNFSLDSLTPEQKEELAGLSGLLEIPANQGFRDIGGECVGENLPSDASASEKGLHLEEFESLDDFLARPIAIDQQSSLILSDSNAFTHHGHRVKRVTLNEDDSDGDPRPKSRKPQRPSGKGASRGSSASRRLQSGKSYAFPVVLPPFNRDGLTAKNAEANWGSCLLYMESLVIYVFNKKSKDPLGCGATIGSRTGGHKFVFSGDSVNCIEEFTPGQPQTFRLTFETSLNGWRMVGVQTDGFEVNANNEEWLKRATETNVYNMDIGAPLDYNFGCSRTKSAVFATNDGNYDVGLVQAGGYLVDEETGAVRFTQRTFDCVGTFSAESLMGIIVSILLFSVFIFGFLMLNSVQSVRPLRRPQAEAVVDQHA
ncbi:hypothetical protein M3Y99_00315700 [Aphelenchoides fujianensis]|nr:hypothetical protein M3Y99_00315700 [Aphelenchoides fujianensis]